MSLPISTPWGERDDAGMALVLVIGAVALLVVLLTGAFYMSSQTMFQSQMADQHDAAFQAASSGALVAFTELQSLGSNLPATMEWDGSMPGDTASYEVEVVFDQAQMTYACISTGTARDGTVEVVEAVFAVSAGRPSKLPWGNNAFYFGDYAGGSIVGNGMLNGPCYVIFPSGSTNAHFVLNSAAAEISGGPLTVENGDVSIKAAPAGPVDVYTNGRLTGNAAGSPNLINRGWDPARALPVTEVNVPAFLDASRASAISQSSDNRIGDTEVANYEAASVGDPSAYSSLSLSPPNNRPTGWVRTRAANAAAQYKVLNSGLTITGSTPSFGSWSGDGHYPMSSGVHDDFAYDASNGVLYIEGTVYVNGDVVISEPISYVGNGTIVCSGSIRIDADVLPATPSGDDGIPDPDARHLLGLFTPNDLVMGSNNTRIVAACYMAGRLQVQANNTTLKGSFVSERGLGTLSNGTVLTALPQIADYISPGLPFWGTGGSTTGGGLVMTAWRRR